MLANLINVVVLSYIAYFKIQIQNFLYSVELYHVHSYFLLTLIQFNYIVCVYTDDLSKNKHATQSTTALSSTDYFIAGKAVDRDITTCMRTEPIGGTSPYKTVRWRVDLGEVYNIYSVNILFKNYYGLGIY